MERTTMNKTLAKLSEPLIQWLNECVIKRFTWNRKEILRFVQQMMLMKKQLPNLNLCTPKEPILLWLMDYVHHTVVVFLKLSSDCSSAVRMEFVQKCIARNNKQLPDKKRNNFALFRDPVTRFRQSATEWKRSIVNASHHDWFISSFQTSSIKVFFYHL